MPQHVTFVINSCRVCAYSKLGWKIKWHIYFKMNSLKSSALWDSSLEPSSSFVDASKLLSSSQSSPSWTSVAMDCDLQLYIPYIDVLREFFPKLPNHHTLPPQATFLLEVLQTSLPIPIPITLHFTQSLWEKQKLQFLVISIPTSYQHNQILSLQVISTCILFSFINHLQT